MYKKTLTILMILASISLVCAMESGLNYYDSFQDSMNIPIPNKTYQLAFIMDDFGTMVNTPTIADIDNDGVNELLIPEYSGKLRIWNWTGMKMGLREGYDTTDRGTYYLSNAQQITGDGVDNNGNGYLEMILNDYSGYLRVLEYDGTTISSIYNEPSDRGNYRSSPTWCDIDNDGDSDIFTCSYSGVCRLYTYNAGTYSLSFTDSDRGTYHYGNKPVCADIDNDGDLDLAVNDYEGRMNLYEWSGGALSWVAETSDVGNYYTHPNVGDFLGDGNNYTITCSTNGLCYAYNCSSGLSSCVLMDSSNDIGSFSYGTAKFHKIRIDGKDYLLGHEVYGQLVLVELVSPTSLTITRKGLDIDARSHVNMGIAKVTNDYDYTLRATRHTASIAVDKYIGSKNWETIQYTKDIQNQFFSKSMSQGFLYISGFVCGQLNHDTPEDECVIISYEGIPYVYTYQNITEYRQEVYSDYELSFLDIMPRDATHYLIEGESDTYCVNEERNILKYSLGGGQIDAWANVYDDEGSAISNYERITDGVLSTAPRFHNQNGANDYTSWDYGTNQYMDFNMSKPVQLGQLKFWGYFSDNRDTLNLRIQISNTSCDNPNFVTIFNESNGDITGANNYQGVKVRFKPQDVQCIRLTADGARYSQTAYTNSNHITQLEGYYANNCTFYTSPLDFLNANIHSDYNVSVEMSEGVKTDSPNQIDNNYQSLFRSPLSQLLNVIDRMIIWITKY